MSLPFKTDIGLKEDSTKAGYKPDKNDPTMHIEKTVNQNSPCPKKSKGIVHPVSAAKESHENLIMTIASRVAIRLGIKDSVRN
jgi:hypothetical protein